MPHNQHTAAQSHLRILATSDVHMRVTGFDDRETPGAPTSGLARLGHTITELHDSAPGACVLLDNGDSLQGDPLAETAFSGPRDDTHPLVSAMHHLGYDAMGLGNHDFDFGTAYLKDVSAALNMPVLCANLLGWPDETIQPHCILTRNLRCSDGEIRALQIGLTSALPAQTAQWARRWLDPEVDMGDPVAHVQRAIKDLRGLGADLVIVLAHTGIAPITDAANPENFALQVARLDGVDAIIAGHTHLQFPGPDHTGVDGVDCAAGTVLGVPCVMPGSAARVLGRIDLTLQHKTCTGWHVAQAECALERGTARSPDAGLKRDLAPARKALRHHLNEPLGHAPRDMHGYFALLRGSQTLGVMGRAMIRAMDRMDIPKDLAHLPRLATVYPSQSGGRAGPSEFVRIPKGRITRRTVLDLAPYEDTLELKHMTGADLRLWLDRSAAIFADLCTSTPEQNLHLADMPGFNFDMFYGLQAHIDPSLPPRFHPDGRPSGHETSRVRLLQYDNRPVADDDRFLVAMSSYRAFGGGHFPDVGTLVTPPGPAIKVRMVAADGVAALAKDALEPLDWRLCQGLGYTTLFETSPAARDHLDEIADLSPEDLGETSNGFLQLRLHL